MGLNKMTDKILFVDDEPNVLHSIQRSLRKRYSLDTAQSGQEALETLERDGPYAVIVSDMQMPEMNGAELLSIAKQSAPATVRIMLTGNADQQTAIDAINKGDILRFLNKPASADQIANALEAGLAQHRLIAAEKELLQDTLRGSVHALAEVLALTNPEIFGRSMRLKTRMHQVAVKMALDDVWQWETIALLALIGCVSVPADIVKKKVAGARMLPEELAEFAFHASAGADLLASIPRMEDVAAAIRYQEKYFDGSGSPDDTTKGETIPLGARMLRAILDLDAYELAGESTQSAFARLNERSGLYDPRVMAALGDVVSNNEGWEIRSVSMAALTDEMQLASDINTVTGMLLITKGQCTTQSVRRHLSKYHANGLIEATVNIWHKTDVEAQP